MNYEEKDEYVQQKANDYCKKEKEHGTLMKIKGVEPLVYKAYKNGYYESEKEHKWHDLRINPNDLPLMIKDEREISNNVWIHVKNWGTEVGYYDYRKKAWIIRCRIVNLDVFGWIEIPTFEE
jgi:hypothetical protein